MAQLNDILYKENDAAGQDVNLAIAANVDAAVAASPNLRLMGFSCRESAAVAAVATFNVVRGATAAGGTVMSPVELAANASTSVWFGEGGLSCPEGISIGVVAGTVDVILFYKV